MDVVFFIENDTKNLSFGQHLQFVKMPAYKKTNHFKKWIAHIQAKERKIITKKILIDLDNNISTLPYFKKKLHGNKRALKYDDLRNLLKLLNYSNYYLDVSLIHSLLTGRSAPKLTMKQEIKLIKMFELILEPFEKHSGNRKNILYYGYMLRKFCEILGWYDILPCLNKLKSDDCLREHDEIWKNMCYEVDWEFIPSSII